MYMVNASNKWLKVFSEFAEVSLYFRHKKTHHHLTLTLTLSAAPVHPHQSSSAAAGCLRHHTTPRSMPHAASLVVLLSSRCHAPAETGLHWGWPSGEWLVGTAVDTWNPINKNRHQEFHRTASCVLWTGGMSAAVHLAQPCNIFPEITGEDNLTVFLLQESESPELRQQCRRADLRQF